MTITIEPHIRGLIFDSDGTLVDTMPLHYLAWEEAMAAEQAHYPEALFYEWAGIPSEKIISMLNERYGYRLEPAKVAAEKERLFLEKYLDRTEPIEPVVAVVRQYKGRLPMAVATGAISSVVQKALEVAGLAGWFEAVVSADDVAHGKPAPDIFLEAARRLGVEPQYCQVFEDSDMGLEAACRAGMVGTDIRPWRNGQKKP